MVGGMTFDVTCNTINIGNELDGDQPAPDTFASCIAACLSVPGCVSVNWLPADDYDGYSPTCIYYSNVGDFISDFTPGDTANLAS